MSRIAYIISAYKDAPHLARLVAALDDRADFYVHIDLNADIHPFEEALGDKVTFVPRHRISWGGWEQVEYQKELLAAVLHSGIPYTRVVCLSGQDYPLWSNNAIHRYFEEHQDTEFIGGFNLTHCTVKQQLHKITHYHPFRDLPWKSIWWKNKLIVASRKLVQILPIRKAPFAPLEGKQADVYFGSDYWAITLPCARYVYEKLCTEEKLVKYFRTSFVPSELCIQTIVFNSPFASKGLLLEGEYPGLTRLTPLHYIDYGASIRVMTLEDLPVLQQSGKMFCRKVVSGESDTLIENSSPISQKKIEMESAPFNYYHYFCRHQSKMVSMVKQYTPEELTQLHQVLYEILEEIVRICDKHNIPYFVIGGTAIGALYDKAILPWDDDIDIGMKREDYNKFLQIASQELREPYFLSWIHTDPHSPYYFAKVKKNNTLFVEEMFKDVPMHQGIFVDIFPFDRIPNNKLLRKIQYEAVNFLKCCLMGKEVWLWKHFGKCQISNPTNRGAVACLLNRIVDMTLSKKTIYRLMVIMQSCFNSWKTLYYNNVITTTDHVLETSLNHLQPIKFGPLYLKAPDGLENFLRYNYPTLHRYTEEEQDKINNHYPAVLSFNIPNDHIATS